MWSIYLAENVLYRHEYICRCTRRTASCPWECKHSLFEQILTTLWCFRRYPALGWMFSFDPFLTSAVPQVWQPDIHEPDISFHLWLCNAFLFFLLLYLIFSLSPRLEKFSCIAESIYCLRHRNYRYFMALKWSCAWYSATRSCPFLYNQFFILVSCFWWFEYYIIISNAHYCRCTRSFLSSLALTVCCA
jgi:hypothetical protein